VSRVANSVIEDLSQLAHSLRDELLGRLSEETSDGCWHQLASQYSSRTGNPEPVRFAGAYAQSVVCTAFAAGVWSEVLHDRAVTDWLVEQADPLVSHVLKDGFSLSDDSPHLLADSPAGRDVVRLLGDRRTQELQEDLSRDHTKEDVPVYFYERFLHVFDQGRRRRRGVFYTPAELVGFIVRSVDGILCEEFQLADGLADTSTWSDMANRHGFSYAASATLGDTSFVRILDPAMGSGAFLLAVVRRCRERFLQAKKTLDAARSPDEWQRFVTDKLLPRLVGFELMLPALVLAQIQLVAQLALSGFRFERAGKLHTYLANTLDEPFLVEKCLGCDHARVTVVVGNPPFSGVSSNRRTWLRNLLRGTPPSGYDKVADYFSIDGQPLGERKHWLEDDYVKFVRYAHWQLERSGAGVIGLVTNHGFLDNPTFRGMRQQLIDTFPRATIIDLHGNAKNRERTPQGEADQNVFAIEQGVTVSLLRSGGSANHPALIEHADLWGRRDEKLEALRSKCHRQFELQTLQPHPPYYFLVPRQFSGSDQYEQGFRLVDVMPLHSTAAVTARDHFLVEFDEAGLLDRLQAFSNLEISDDEIRRRYFTRTRSAKYKAGDTRGWKLADARPKAAAISDLRPYLCEFQYRPFDHRVMFWADWVVDWPRLAVMKHLTEPGNVALVARRQIPSSAPASYFWVTDSIVLDGLIRSDSRGSESMFPLWTRGADPTPNFAAEFIDACSRRLDLKWCEHGAADLVCEFGPQEVFHYIYALFYSPSYRQQFASWLRVDFPRVLLPRGPELFREMAKVGRRLVQLHLLRKPGSSVVRFVADGDSTCVTAGCPKFDGERVWVNPHAYFTPVTSAAWQFRVGTYQVCRKWLRDRLGRELPTQEIQRYCQLVAALTETLTLMQEVDHAITHAGGWAQAY
jgi:predicted helicase